MSEIKRIKVEDIPCRFGQEYWEDVVGDGGPRMQMFDCTCDKKLTPEQEDEMDGVTSCSPKCPGYEPGKVEVCPKHNKEVVDCCDECMNEFYEDQWNERKYEHEHMDL